MFKLRKRKRVQNVVRVEDLQVNDVIQIDLWTQATIQRIIQLNEDKVWIEMNNIMPEDPMNDTLTATLYRNMKIFVWR